MFGEVQVLPVVVPGTIALYGVLVWRWWRRGVLTPSRAAVALVICVYAAGVVANTVFPIYRDKPGVDAPWSAHLVVAPWAEYEASDALMNVAVFVPFGFLVALMATRSSWWRPVAVTALCSLAIEGVQLVTAHSYGGGHIADVHDLIFNVVGGGLGAVLLSLSSRLPVTRGVVDRLRGRDDADRGAPAGGGEARAGAGQSRTT